MKVLNKAVFLDKDGTLIVDIPYNADPEQVVLSNDCLTGLAGLRQEGYLLVVVSNQSGIARGYFSEDDLRVVEQRLGNLLGEAGIMLSGFYYCPHYPGGTVERLSIDCECRKPAPGMLLKAAKDLDIDLCSSWMIGDILNDIEAGNRAGCASILLDNGNETEWLMNEYRQPVAKVKTINQAAAYILKAKC